MTRRASTRQASLRAIAAQLDATPLAQERDGLSIKQNIRRVDGHHIPGGLACAGTCSGIDMFNRPRKLVSSPPASSGPAHASAARPITLKIPNSVSSSRIAHLYPNQLCKLQWNDARRQSGNLIDCARSSLRHNRFNSDRNRSNTYGGEHRLDMTGTVRLGKHGTINPGHPIRLCRRLFRISTNWPRRASSATGMVSIPSGQRLVRRRPEPALGF